ncbi:hypothetical protein WDW37_02970 [Bdellovibrionota bacterium FG-1]
MKKQNTNDFDEYLTVLERKLSKALGRFEASVLRLPSLKSTTDAFTDVELGAYDEMMARFARVTDIFLSQYIRALIKKADPAFRGSFRDSLDQAEKLGYIDSADEWYQIRELRNRQAHEYEEDDLIALFRLVLDQKLRIESIKNEISKKRS